MTDRFICTKEHPWARDEKRAHALHPDAVYVDTEYGSLGDGGSYEVYKCPHCGITFYETLPD